VKGIEVNFHTKEEMDAIVAEAIASQIADQANTLQSIARDAGFVLEVTSVAGLFGVVTVRPRVALDLAVPA